MTSPPIFSELPEEEQRLFVQMTERLASERGWFVRGEDLLDHWHKTIEECRSVYDFTIDEYWNDLDGRRIIEDVLDAAPPGSIPGVRSRLSGLDEEFKRVTVPLETPTWSEDIATQNPAKYFFFYRLPHHPGDEMTEDLLRMKFFSSPAEIERLTEAK